MSGNYQILEELGEYIGEYLPDFWSEECIPKHYFLEESTKGKDDKSENIKIKPLCRSKYHKQN